MVIEMMMIKKGGGWGKKNQSNKQGTEGKRDFFENYMGLFFFIDS